jgi:hypothetical protein
MLAQLHGHFKAPGTPMNRSGNIGAAASLYTVEIRARPTGKERWVNKTIALVIDPALVLWVDASAARQDVPFQELVSNSERYHSRQACTEGAHATGFETNALGAFVRGDGAAVARQTLHCQTLALPARRQV